MLIKRIPRLLALVCLTALLLTGLPAPRAEAAAPKPVQAILTYQDLVILYADGTVASTGKDPSLLGNAADWKSVKALSVGNGALIGLRRDGTLCGAALSDFPAAAGWKNLVSAASTGTHLVALKADGTVLCAGPEHFGTYESYSFSDWKNVSQLAAGRSGAGEYAVGLLRDGSVRSDFLPGDWTGRANRTAAISCSGYLLLALQRDGTVAAAGQDAAQLSEEISSWTGVTQVCAGDTLAVALKKDGTVLTAGNAALTEALSAWENVRALYLGAGGIVFGVHKDGSVSVEPKDRARFNPWAVECWTNVDRLLCADESRVVAVSKSGELLTAGTFIPGAAAPASPKEVTDSQGRNVESVMQTYGMINRADGPSLRWDGQGRVTQMCFGAGDSSRGVFTWRYDGKGRLTEYRMEARTPLPAGEAEHVIEHGVVLRYASDGGVTAEVTRRVSSDGGVLHRWVGSFNAEGELVKSENSDKEGSVYFISGSPTLENVLHDW